MSIPKEPRALMINLMYLVLTAMLALNVSAKIINAFFSIDKGIQKSNNVIDKANVQMVATIEKGAQENAKYKPVADAAAQVSKLSKEFASYVDEVRELVAVGDAKPGDEIYYPDTDKDHPGQPHNYKNKDVTTRILVNEAKGAELAKKIDDTKAAMMKVVTDLLKTGNYGMKADEFEKTFGPQITLSTGDEWKNEGSPSWEHHNFFQMPVAATWPMFTKIKNDAKNTEATLIGYLTSLVGIQDIKVDAFQPVTSPKKSYVIEGEEFETELGIAAVSKAMLAGSSIAVNGSSVPTKDGIATYKTRASGIGPKKYSVSISVKNPATGETISAKKDFEYEVGRRSVAVAADKMNVFYIGVDNPISIAAAGVSSNQLQVSSTGAITISGTGSNRIVKATGQGDCTIKVSAPGLSQEFKFRVKRIPDPIARLGKESSGSMGNGEFKAQPGVRAELVGFDFEATCNIESFEMYRQAKRADAVSMKNSGPRFSEAKTLQAMAVPGDLFYFDEIKARCPGDAAGRKLNSMTWKIK